MRAVVSERVPDGREAVEDLSGATVSNVSAADQTDGVDRERDVHLSSVRTCCDARGHRTIEAGRKLVLVEVEVVVRVPLPVRCWRGERSGMRWNSRRVDELTWDEREEARVTEHNVRRAAPDHRHVCGAVSPACRRLGLEMCSFTTPVSIDSGQLG